MASEKLYRNTLTQLQTTRPRGLCDKVYKKNSVEPFWRYTEKCKRSTFRINLPLKQWWEKRLVFRNARKKIHQNFHVLEYDIKRSLLTLLKINLSYLELFYQTIYHDYWRYKVWNIFAIYLNSSVQNFLLLMENICLTPHFKFQTSDFQ